MGGKGKGEEDVSSNLSKSYNVIMTVGNGMYSLPDESLNLIVMSYQTLRKNKEIARATFKVLDLLAVPNRKNSKCGDISLMSEVIIPTSRLESGSF